MALAVARRIPRRGCVPTFICPNVDGTDIDTDSDSDSEDTDEGDRDGVDCPPAGMEIW